MPAARRTTGQGPAGAGAPGKGWPRQQPAAPRARPAARRLDRRATGPASGRRCDLDGRPDWHGSRWHGISIGNSAATGGEVVTISLRLDL